ncbi:isocitrate dehydrogenase [Wuchereria bancrofti]|uniref:Isocitrate dehydrogenase [NAD] subunit, mitochondrial n=1 Tax=Wuchereria bancrofti TaxID=6293 RepID=J9EVV5_WUCBA|nr:isocitrate dehydrogenase [Wuchereria bancrofti]
MKVTVIPGDGVGVELTHAVQKIVQSTGIPLEFEEVFLSEIQHSCSANLEEVIKSVRKNNNVALKGAIKEADETVSNRDREDINRALKKSLNGIRTRHQKNLDFVIIREQTEGEYSSLEHELIPGVVECLKITTEEKSYRIAKFAFDYATKFGRHKVTAIHKANIMKLGDGLFLRNCEEVSKLYPNIKFESMIIDNCCMQLVSRPEQFDVMVMPNLYGNIVGNLGAGLVGGAGVVAGRSIGSDAVIFEPGARHAYQQAFGKQIANPTAMILCCADLLQHLRLQKYGAALRSATEAVVAEGKIRTRDLGGCSSTLEFTDAVIQKYTL